MVSRRVGVHEINEFTSLTVQMENLNKKVDALMSAKSVNLFNESGATCAGVSKTMQEQANQVNDFNRQ